MSSHGPDNSDGHELVTLPGQRIPDEESQIGGCTASSSVQAGVHMQSDNNEHVVPNEMDPDESAGFWADLKDETGYDSYVDYLEKVYGDVYPHLKILRRFLDTLPDIPERDFTDGYQTCAILELQDEPSARPKINFPLYSLSEGAIIRALRRPSAKSAIRVLLWEPTTVDKETVDAFGVGLKLHPDFFRALLFRYKIRTKKISYLSLKNMADRFDERSMAPEVVFIGNYLVTKARHYLPGNQDATPVIVIFNLDEGFHHRMINLGETLPEEGPVTKEASGPIKSLPAWMQEYIRLLNLDLHEWGQLSAIDKNISIKLLSPLVQSYIFCFCENCDSIRNGYLEFALLQNKFRSGNPILKRIPLSEVGGKIKGLEDLFEMRDLLRRMIEKSEDHRQRLRRFMRPQKLRGTWQKEPSTTIEDDLQEAHSEALRLEAEIRDYLQLQTGQLALQESRKSIELSGFQIEESKRVKIFTILAFVYVPLNLATSIFGMNIEQLNGNGQRLSVFITTAVVTLAVTGGSWFVIEQINSYRKWRRERAEQQYDGKTRFSLAVRLALIVFLVWNRHTHWMFRSGAWWRVIINHGSRLLGPYDGRKGSLTAGEYVSKYSKDDLWVHYPSVGRAFRLDSLENVHWTSAQEGSE